MTDAEKDAEIERLTRKLNMLTGGPQRKHPTFDGAKALDMNDPLNVQARELMWYFYLGQGFAEPPDWDDLSDDFRFGFRGVARHIQKSK